MPPRMFLLAGKFRHSFVTLFRTKARAIETHSLFLLLSTLPYCFWSCRFFFFFVTFPTQNFFYRSALNCSPFLLLPALLFFFLTVSTLVADTILLITPLNKTYSNYFGKVHLGDEKYVHVRAHKSNSGEISFYSLLTTPECAVWDKDTPLEYFID